MISVILGSFFQKVDGDEKVKIWPVIILFDFLSSWASVIKVFTFLSP